MFDIATKNINYRQIDIKMGRINKWFKKKKKINCI